MIVLTSWPVAMSMAVYTVPDALKKQKININITTVLIIEIEYFA